MSNIRWFNTPINSTSSMNGKVVMTWSQVNQLWRWALESPLTSIIFGDYSKWCSSLMMYPFNLTTEENNHYLLAGGIKNINELGETRIGCKIFPTDNYRGYTLGEHYFPPAESFLDFLPYKTVQIWLPYYGYIDMNMLDIQDQYIQFRLFVDYNTGMAKYVIGASNTSIPYNTDNDNEIKPIYFDANADVNVRIISEYTFQLGVDIPISSTGWADSMRNIALAVVTKGGSLAAQAITQRALPAPYRLKLTKTGTGGLAVTRVPQADSRRRTKSQTFGADLAASAVSGIGDVLAAFHTVPSIDKSNNSSLNSSTSNSIIIVISKTKPTLNPENSYYRHLYGKPTGQADNLGVYTGYTECSKIHFEGSGFSQATSMEMSMIEEAFGSGVIL